MKLNSAEILSFTLGEQRFGIPLSSVDRIHRAVAVTKIPDSPEIIYGVINYHGEIIAVINLKSKLKLTYQPIQLNDRLIVANTSSRKIALVVDEVEGVLNPLDIDFNKADNISPGLQISGICNDSKGMLLIYDIEKLLNTLDKLHLEKVIELAEVA